MMTRGLLQVFVTQFLFNQVMSSYAHPYSIKPYVVREPTQIPHKVYVTEHRGSHQSYPPNYSYQAYKITEPVAIPAPIAPVPVPEPRAINAIPTKNDLEAPSKGPSNLDSHVLNNLAIALQLLILNNIISHPPEPSPLASPLTDAVLELAFPSNKMAHSHEFQMPNSKFLGSSGLGTDLPNTLMGMGTVATSPRAGLMLMSPYDAIASSVPLSESLSSPYLSKRDFQSPYAAIMAADNNKDLFSLVDFY